jgi:chromosome segregation ATPase
MDTQEDATVVTTGSSQTVTDHRPQPAFSTSTQHRLGLRKNDLDLVQGASAAIADLGAELDRSLAREKRAAERLRMLRETTNRITRTANDAVHAYRRASRAIKTELERPDANVAAAEEMRRRLDEARAEVLRALEVAQERYPQGTDDVARPGDSSPG